MQALNRTHVTTAPLRPLKVVQFGEGNFLRAFVDYAIDELNRKTSFNGGVAVVQPIAQGMVPVLQQQDGLYTLFSNGISQGEKIQEQHLVESIQVAIDPYTQYDAFLALAEVETLEVVISNTTEAGIAYAASDTLEMRPQNSFPAKLTAFLYHRFQFFKGDVAKGLAMIPCELINYNADTLREVVLRYAQEWNCGTDFITWLQEANSFHNTLVDRIVPGYPKNEVAQYQQRLEYKDALMVVSEAFFLWVIEGDATLQQKLPFHQTELDVKFVADMQPYRTRKVRILNGAHTVMVPLSLLYGNATVGETLEKPFTASFVEHSVFKEIILTLELDPSELQAFAQAVLDRFRNPFVEHQLSSIALNSISKFKVRVLPSLLTYQQQHNKLPVHLTYAFACLLRFYQGSYQNRILPVRDEATIMDDMAAIWKGNTLPEAVNHILAQTGYWGENLNAVPQLHTALVQALEALDKYGVEAGFGHFKASQND